VNIKMTGLQRGFSPEKLVHNIKTAKHLITAGAEAGRIIREFKPDAVIGTGAYVCYPVLKKAARMGIPTFIHEQNAVPGLANKLLSASVDKVLVSFPGLEKQFKRPERVVFTGTPVRGEFIAEQKGRQNLKPLVVSFWGSLGAAHMNEVMAEFIKRNIDESAFDHIHATGGKRSNVDEMIIRLENLVAPTALPQGIQIREYIDDMPSVMASADIVLCRAGATTIAELTVLGKPAMLVPSPNVTNNQQEENAKQLQKSGGAVMILEKDCTGEKLYDAVLALLKDKEKLKSMSDAQKALGAPNAARKIVELIIDVC
ncbi:MAG: UDP-N-acetylglucosamine--N-acetylmuramyl-(pentapeptide) pyrophosphoryl-undecaprenol N-acetylglucosamine transferase, partial [Oscillospiraceae bacterium]|nr:UDP-N-acetylglucosamine--N-acetylmuramyl-(pentapeptide) pyrophosphoryl-undecaprenol N-acetylglucosamine transferase [Oscillospiraceae bacterium]